jgi:hypothetical protein
MRREVKTYEWVCDRCGVVEETRAVEFGGLRVPFTFAVDYADLPAGWRVEKSEKEKSEKETTHWGCAWSQRTICGGCEERR